MAIRLKAAETPLGDYIEGTYTETYYECPTCKGNFDESDFETIEVLYNPAIVGHHYGSDDEGDPLRYLSEECTQCSGGMLYILRYSGTNEDAWTCGDGCFNHDLGTRPNTLTREVKSDDDGEYEGSGEIWQCGKCRQTYWQAHYGGDADDAKESAIQCCQ